ncbi:outer membrane beta-barrel protein [uncultured Alistipes sp.]|jgi:hypothetical protein|uniref:outer membrane beta-barrel protein n=1 Tax=uncultured Alistipes sp. TaxID=538949 RepID=UPI0025D7E3CC|nr:outer membrane beta-barrel protein [uncultured Alistipes sp.]
MKKTCLLTGILIMLAFLPAPAQNKDSKRSRKAKNEIPPPPQVTIETIDRDSLGIDTLRRIDMFDSGLIQLRDAGSDGNMILEVAGFGITLGHTPAQKAAVKPSKMKLQLLANFELGFTQLTGVDYAGYLPEQKDFLDQQLGPSFHFSFSIVQFKFALNRSRSLNLAVGMQYTVDNFRLNDKSVTLGKVDGRIVPVQLERPADKSKLRTTSLGIPLRLIYSPAKHVRISAIAYSDFMLGADAIYKKPKQKHGLSGLRTYQFGVGASVSYYGVGIFARYGLIPVFKNNVGPDCHMLTFGFSLAM